MSNLVIIEAAEQPQVIINSADSPLEIIEADDVSIVLEIASGGGGGVTVHNDLTSRDAANCHPQSAITDLVSDLAAKANSASLAAVATSGAYGDLSGTPSLAAVATSGAYGDLSGTPTIPSNHNDLANRDASDCHPQGAITGLSTVVSQVGTNVTNIGTLQTDVYPTESVLAAAEIDLSVNRRHSKTMTADTAFTFANVTGGRICILRLSGAYNPTFTGADEQTGSATYDSAKDNFVVIYALTDSLIKYFIQQDA